MNLFDTVLKDITFIIMPLMVYLLYIAYSNTLDKKENNLIFVIAIFSQIYLMFKEAIPIYSGMPLFIINIPIFLSFYKKSNISILLSLIACILYYYNYYNDGLFLLIIEYLIYYLIYKFINKKTNIKIFVISLFKVISLIILSKEINFYILSEGALLYTFTVYLIFLLEKTEDMLKLHKNIKRINHDKDVETSLFKITHEIKNPIAVCKGYLDMYDENKIEKFKKYVPILKEEIDKILILLEDFLSMNKLKINKDILDINLLLEDVIKNTELLFLKNNINLDTKISEDEIYINGDYNRLTQVFINIIKNSIESLDKSKNPKIKIWTKKEKDKINIFIKDNGIGMSKQTLEKIKEPFYTTKDKGSGLGVSLSNEIIKAHNGKLNYESEIKKYTLVTIILPLEKAI